MKHDNLTIVAVYGHNDGAAAIPAIMKSMHELPDSKGLLLSWKKPEHLPEDIQWKMIGSLNYLEYSPWMMHCLDSFIETEHCLVVQDDGWVLDGNNWKDEFYGYDYLGAPSHCGFLGGRPLLRFEWEDRSGVTVVQNGGFSLRSKRLLGAPNRHGIVHRVSSSNDIHFWNEDAQLSGILRPVFEHLGYRYASIETARDFAIEYVGPKTHKGYDFNRLLGHHGQSRKLVGDMKVQMNVTRQELVNVLGEAAFTEFLIQKGYEVTYVSNTAQG